MFKLTSRTLAGVKFFTTKRFISVPPPKPSTDPAQSIEDVLTRMGLTMMEIKDKPEEIGMIKKLVFFDVFEAMIQLLLVSFSIFVWATVKAAIWPEEISSASGWTTAISVVLMLVSVQSLLQIALMTGSRAAETRMALVVAFWAFLVLVFVDVIPATSTLSETAAHVNALVAQVSHRLEVVPLHAMESLVHISTAMLLALVSAALTIPALRYTQTLQQLTNGRSFERTKDILVKLLLWLEFIAPLFVILTFNPWFTSSHCVAEGHLAPNDDNHAVCSEKDERIATAKLYMQLGSLTWMVLLRVLGAKRHLQAFMDVSVATVSQALVTTNAGELQQLKIAIESRSKYMLAAATQLLSVIGIFLALWITFLRAVIHRVLADLSSLVLHLLQQYSSESWISMARQQATQIQHGATQWLLVNNTEILANAMKDPATPSLETAVFATMGVIGREAQLALDTLKEQAGEGAKQSLMQVYMTRVVGAHPLPAVTAVAALQGIIFWLTTIWFAVNVLSLGMWVLAPQWFTRTISESNGGGGSSSASASKPATADKGTKQQ